MTTMNFNDPIIIASAFTTVGVILGTIINYLLQQRRAVAEPAKMLANGFGSLVEGQQAEIKDLRTLITELRNDIEGLTAENTYLQEQIDSIIENYDRKIKGLTAEVERLRKENRRLGQAAEQMRQQLIVK
jgi:predicted RNase H-like nuclease (RuvC/YqgF family)